MLETGNAPGARRSCNYAGCERHAAVALRFGDGTMYRHGGGRKRQGFAFYCHEHAFVVRHAFLTCDERQLIQGALPRHRRPNEIGAGEPWSPR